VFLIEIDLAPSVFPSVPKPKGKGARPSPMENIEAREKDKLIASPPQPIAEVDILKIEKKILIEKTSFLERLTPDKKTGPA